MCSPWPWERSCTCMGAQRGHFHPPAHLLTHESNLCPQSRAFCKGAGELGGKSPFSHCSALTREAPR